MDKIDSAFVIATVCVIVVAILSFSYKFDIKKSFRYNRREVGIIALALFFCIIVAVIILSYPTCPKCDARLEVFTDDYCAICGAKVKEYKTCSSCGEELDLVADGCCGYCGTKITVE